MEPSQQSPIIKFLQEVKRSRNNRMLGGVCGGLAAKSEIPDWVYRVGFIALAAVSIGVFAYVALWIFMPEEALGQAPPLSDRDE